MGAAVVQLAVAAALFALPASAAADYEHVVAPGETLTSIAAQDGLSEAALAAANGLPATAELIAGSLLAIPPQNAAGASSPGETSAPSSEAAEGSTDAGAVAVQTSDYVVQPGDTLSAIAARAGVTVAALAAANGLDPNRILLSGSTLRLPTAVVVSTATPSASPTTTSTGAVTEVSTATATGTAGPPYPTHEFASPSQIAQIATSNGVPAALAQAISWQESGFNNAEVSPDGAVGAMQIIPSTWAWINNNLTNGATLAPASVASNVTGGVLLLHSLLVATGSEAEAAAGYYQGLSSVQKVGMYSSTQQYVADVLALAHRFGG